MEPVTQIGTDFMVQELPENTAAMVSALKAKYCFKFLIPEKNESAGVCSTLGRASSYDW